MSNEKGVKHDTGKNQLDLVPPELDEAVGKILTFGAVKYGPHNWRGGLKYSRVVAALLRHLNAYRAGKVLDPETGMSHLWHAGCNLAFLITFDEHPEQYAEFNDLWRYGVPGPEEVVVGELPAIEIGMPPTKESGPVDKAQKISPCEEVVLTKLTNREEFFWGARVETSLGLKGSVVGAPNDGSPRVFVTLDQDRMTKRAPVLFELSELKRITNGEEG